MTEFDAIARNALTAAKAGGTDEARALLARIKDVDPKPPLYWYALSQCWAKDGEHELAYNCLFAFNGNLHGKHMELLGLGTGRPDPNVLIRLGGPENILGERREADAYRERGDFRSAIQCMSRVIDWRISELESLGHRLFG